ncbi:MAG TPA: NAD(P)H-hydrate epimerase [Anaerolineaceae bacterium]|nr:NAD(P)H-hydrate epimerase [Anaerolineaceae bacterium]
MTNEAIMSLPQLTTAQMAEVDRLMIEVYNISLVQMMENAGRNLADCAQNLTRNIDDPSFLLLIGSGNNGGGGLAAARHLINRGFNIKVKLIKNQTKLKGIVNQQWEIINHMGDYIIDDPSPEHFDLIIDSMVGYGLQGEPKENLAAWINRINASKRPVLSLDVPSGLDATTGIPYIPCAKAAATLTLALPKRGLLTEEAKPYVGDLYLTDISVPNHLYKTMGLEVGPIFKDGPIIKIL